MQIIFEKVFIYQKLFALLQYQTTAMVPDTKNPIDMETFTTTLDLFLNELANYAGSTPTIKIDYRGKKLTITECSGGFIKALSNDDRWILSMTAGEGLVITRFKA